MHDAMLLPFSNTVQARHWPSPQPYFVPVNSRSSRSTSSSGRSGSVATVRRLPLTVKWMVAVIEPRAMSSVADIQFLFGIGRDRRDLGLIRSVDLYAFHSKILHVPYPQGNFGLIHGDPPESDVGHQRIRL